MGEVITGLEDIAIELAQDLEFRGEESDEIQSEEKLFIAKIWCDNQSSVQYGWGPKGELIDFSHFQEGLGCNLESLRVTLPAKGYAFVRYATFDAKRMLSRYSKKIPEQNKADRYFNEMCVRAAIVKEKGENDGLSTTMSIQLTRAEIKEIYTKFQQSLSS